MRKAIKITSIKIVNDLIFLVYRHLIKERIMQSYSEAHLTEKQQTQEIIESLHVSFAYYFLYRRLLINFSIYFKMNANLLKIRIT